MGASKMNFRCFPKLTKTGLEHEAVRQKCVSEASQNQQKTAWNTKRCVKNAFPKLPKINKTGLEHEAVRQNEFPMLPKINKNWPGTRSCASKMRFRSFPKSTQTGLEHEAVRQKCVSEASQNQQKLAWNTE